MGGETQRVWWDSTVRGKRTPVLRQRSGNFSSMTDVNSAFFQDYFLQVSTASGMHQTGICQSSYGAQFRINKKGKPRLWLVIDHTAIQRIPRTSQSFPHDSRFPSTAFMTRSRSGVLVRNLKPTGSCFSRVSGFGRSRILVRRKLSEFQGIVQKKRLLKSEGRKAVRQTSPLFAHCCIGVGRVLFFSSTFFKHL